MNRHVAQCSLLGTTSSQKNLLKAKTCGLRVAFYPPGYPPFIDRTLAGLADCSQQGRDSSGALTKYKAVKATNVEFDSRYVVLRTQDGPATH